jgi:hypothetical protein
MSEHVHEQPVNSAKLLLPVVILGMLCLMMIMYYFGGNAGVAEYQDHGTQTATHASGGH